VKGKEKQGRREKDGGGFGWSAVLQHGIDAAK
jgi:hypothetical protein